MTASRIAIIIPAFNAASTVGETLVSLQANKGLEKIALVALLDDGSTDDTALVAKKHWHADTPLEAWRNAINMGERRSTNEAMARLGDHVDWTFILHADDVVKTFWLSFHLGELMRVPEKVASVCSSYDVWWPATGRIEPGDDKPQGPAVLVPGGRAEVRGTIEKGCWWHVTGSAIRNAAFRDIGGFEPDMPQHGDWEWLLRCLSKGWGIWYVPRTTLLYRQHGTSVSSRSFREARDLKERLRILKSMHAQGYLGGAEYKAHVRRTIRQMTRRSLVRVMRGDAYGFRKHASLLMGTGAGYLRGKL